MSDGAGKAAHAFLQHITGELWLFAAMMSDGACETMNLIRFLDDENVSTVELCDRVQQFLAHVTWLFFAGGVFLIDGHTSFIVRWYENAAHHFVVGGVGRSIGGIKFSNDIREKCCSHMQSWVVLVEHTLKAEFPSMDIVSCFSVFRLYRNSSSAKSMSSLNLTSDVETKLRRLAKVFKQPDFPAQFKNVFQRAYHAFVKSNFMMTYWECWREGIRYTTCATSALLHVIKRGEVFAPVTSGIEQNFAKIHERLGENRLHAAAHVEDRNINLICAKLNGGQLDDLMTRAVNIWKECFHRHSRVQTQVRKDKGLVLDSGSKQSRCDPNSERSFLKRLHDDIANNAKPTIDVGSMPKPSSWSASHENELVFQKEKYAKKVVEADLRGHLLPEEESADLRQASIAESARQASSYIQRVNARKKYAGKTTAVPPTLLEMNAVKVFLDTGLTWTPEWLQRLGAIGCSVAANEHVASFFISSTPRRPSNLLVSMSAILQGAWVVSPAVFFGRSGPSIKYLCALQTKRSIWASPSFCENFRKEWLLILELISSRTNRWTVLGSAQDWATARAIAESKGTPSQVLSLVGLSECDPSLKHSFAPEGFLAFVGNADPQKGSIGLLDM